MLILRTVQGLFGDNLLQVMRLLPKIARHATTISSGGGTVLSNR